MQNIYLKIIVHNQAVFQIWGKLKGIKIQHCKVCNVQFQHGLHMDVGYFEFLSIWMIPNVDY